MAEDTDTKPEAPETKSYVLKEGMEHTGIVKGEKITAVGDGKVTFDLTDAQYASFQDKFAGENVLQADPTSIQVGTETGNYATITDAAAAASAAANPGTGTESDGNDSSVDVSIKANTVNDAAAINSPSAPTATVPAVAPAAKK